MKNKWIKEEEKRKKGTGSHRGHPILACANKSLIAFLSPDTT
jgi:hypothetical protein